MRTRSKVRIRSAAPEPGRRHIQLSGQSREALHVPMSVIYVCGLLAMALGLFWLQPMVPSVLGLGACRAP